MDRTIKDYLIKFVRKYSLQIIDKNIDKKFINEFDIKKASEASINAMKTKDLSDKQKEMLDTEEFLNEVMTFFEEKLVVNYFMFKRNISYYQAKALLIDKGTDFFPETKGIISKYYKGKYKDFPASDKQKKYIEDFNVLIKHDNELSSREASQIIKCLKNDKRIKPNYYSYYIIQ
jgi:hypothetical protein